MADKLHMKLRQEGLGPGGWKCVCCSPPKSKRLAWCRAKKRSERNDTRRDINLALAEAVRAA
jgi:hypothetical protein